MYKFKNSIIAFGGLLLLIGAISLATPHVGSIYAVDNDDRRMVSFPQVAHGLVVGEKIRTILINRGTRPISVQVFVLDADGEVVKQEALLVTPGRMDTSEVNCAEATCPGPEPETPSLLSLGDPRSKLLRTEVRLRAADVPFLFMASAVVDDSTGNSRSAVDRLASNHNETLVRDTSPMK